MSDSENESEPPEDKFLFRREIREGFPRLDRQSEDALYRACLARRDYALAVHTNRAHLFGYELDSHERVTNQLETVWMDAVTVVRAFMQRVQLTPEQRDFIDDAILTPPEVWLD
jgi:hypothetical protein